MKGIKNPVYRDFIKLYWAWLLVGNIAGWVVFMGAGLLLATVTKLVIYPAVYSVSLIFSSRNKYYFLNLGSSTGALFIKLVPADFLLFLLIAWLLQLFTHA
ncbi:hypothetical protein [Hufsiella ginkgonis]|uniref:Uncharacterized protein n=1 Tax=Hufsiella ginkgonis TaxID=2695274 RepID=A0A7K1XZM2_9SPHI|nr:hypothetical protein [Hufsiella ginkgonis]MXV16420.1 hypothetical protein [Hufsiella ginkgonis]